MGSLIVVPFGVIIVKTYVLSVDVDCHGVSVDVQVFGTDVSVSDEVLDTNLVRNEGVVNGLDVDGGAVVVIVVVVEVCIACP